LRAQVLVATSRDRTHEEIAGMAGLENLVTNMVLGFGVALSLQNILYCLLGVTVGTLVGVLPGIGSIAAMAILLPITFSLPPVSAIIMLAGIYYGSMYGGSTTAILVNIPGSAASAVICLDGYPLAQKGRAGPALVITTIASFVGGSIATVLLMMAGPPLAEVALKFGAPEYTSLMIMALIATSVVATGSMLKGIAMTVLGLLVGIAGTDVNSGMQRFTFGMTGLADGIHFVVVLIGLFGIAELLRNLEPEASKMTKYTSRIRFRDLLPTKEDFKVSVGPTLRGSAIGSFFGILPGTGASTAAFTTYAIEKKLAKDPSIFGKGAVQGITGADSSNNATAMAAFIPTLSLGIPGSASMAIMLGALTIHGIQPGPQVMTNNPDLFWGLIASMWIGNVILVILNFPLIGVWVKLLSVPYRFLFPCIIAFCGIGMYTVNNNPQDVYLMIGFGIVGYVFLKLRCEPAPLLIGFILGPLLEENFRRALLISRGDPSVFFTRPISLGFLIGAVFFFLIIAIPTWKKMLRQSREQKLAQAERTG
jgi:putative tricarboxylic transport membrane protein